jgi:hypothetical protein
LARAIARCGCSKFDVERTDFGCCMWATGLVEELGDEIVARSDVRISTMLVPLKREFVSAGRVFLYVQRADWRLFG